MEILKKMQRGGGESSAMKITCSIIFYKVLSRVDNAAATCIKRIQDIN